MITDLTNDYRQLPIPPQYSTVEMDMGCGKGKFTLELARKYPDRLVISSDVMIGRLRRLDARVSKQGLENVCMLRAESAQAAEYQLPWQSIDRVHILCPDPWPRDKKRVRRLVCSSFLCSIRRILKPGGILHMSTDHLPYFEDWSAILSTLPFFRNAPQAIEDIADLKTDFELQWLAEGKAVNHLSYQVI